MIPGGERAQPLMRSELGYLQPQAAILFVLLLDRALQLREPVTLLGDLEPYHQHRKDDQDDCAHQDRGQQPGRLFHRADAAVHDAVRSTHRSRALRALGFCAISSAVGRIALRTGKTNSALSANSRRRFFTARSSSEWYASTTIRPPAARRIGARSSSAARLSSSWFTAIRSAWKVRVAGWTRPRCRQPSTRSAIRRSSPVVEIRGCSRALTIARAIRREARSSPYSYRIRASSASLSPLTRSAAVSACSGFIRMSSGPSKRKLKPREGSSSARLLIPRSATIASTRSSPVRSRTASIAAKSA